MFKRILNEFEEVTRIYYKNIQDNVGGMLIHVPIPVKRDDVKFALEALVYTPWGTVFMGKPSMILQVFNNESKFINFENHLAFSSEVVKQIEKLKYWHGPVLDREFDSNMDRLLKLSVEIFDNYVLDTKDTRGKEYAERFFAVTPTEFIYFYQKINSHFVQWLMSQNR